MKALRQRLTVGTGLLMLAVCLFAVSGAVSAGADELWTSSASLPAGIEANDGKVFVLQSDVTISAPANYGSKVSGSGITIDLNGHTVTSTGVSSGAGVFIVTNGGKLTVKDSSAGQTGNLKGPDTQNRVVYIYGNAAGTAFTLAGGNISGNTARNGIVSSAISTSALQGVTFNMTGGRISGNTITEPTGIVYLNREGDVFNKTGGTVSGNTYPEGGAETVVYNMTPVTGEPAGRLDAARVEVSKDLTVYFYAAYDRSIADSVLLEVSRGGETARLSGTYHENGENYGKYEFIYPGVMTQCMTEPLSARLIFSAGGEETVLDTLGGWTVAGYADSLHTLYPAKAELCTLLADLLEYGAAAQLHEGFMTDDLANAFDWVSAEKTAAYTGASGAARAIGLSSDPAKRFTGASLRIGRGGQAEDIPRCGRY